MYTKGDIFPHPAKLYKQLPQSTQIKWCVKESFHTSSFFVVHEGLVDNHVLATGRLVSTRFKAMVDDVP